jgi:hypothetical protein
MADNRVEFRYTAGDVTATQRYRMLHSSQFKLLLVFWGLGLAFVALHALLPNVFTFIPGVTLEMVGIIGLVYVGSLLALLYIIPWISFNFTRFWRLPLVFTYNNQGIRLMVAGKTGGLRLDWEKVRKVEEAPRAFILYYEDNTKHFLLPKSAFSAGAERRFRSLVDRYVNTPAGSKPVAQKAPEPVEEEAEEEENIKE